MSNTELTPEEIECRKRWFEDYMRALEYHSIVEARQEGVAYRCPCCSCRTLEGRGHFEICPVCFWEDDGQDDADADAVRGGPNGLLSLAQARRNYAEFGACDHQSLQHVRKPAQEEL